MSGKPQNSRFSVYNPRVLESSAYSRYAPTQLEIDNLSIHLHPSTLSNLTVDTSEYLLIGEYANSNTPVYTMIVEEGGVAINSARKKNSFTSNNNENCALYVDGDVIISGKVRANLFTGIDSTINTTNQNNLWYTSYDTNKKESDMENIYSTSKITIGDGSVMANSFNNNYGLNISKFGNRDIDKVQLHIENNYENENGVTLKKDGSINGINIGIIGKSIVSPAIINTGPYTSLEFHAQRGQDYFSSMYTNIHGDVQDIPNYTLYNQRNNAPHMIISVPDNATFGTVGINTSMSQARIFNILTNSTNNEQISISLSNVADIPSLHVEGGFFACNVLIHDHVSGNVCNIDELFVRQLGNSIAPSSINGGSFLPKSYAFPGNLSIGDSTDTRDGITSLTVYSDVHFKKDLIIDGDLKLNNISNTSITTNQLSVSDTAYVNKIVNNDQLWLNSTKIFDYTTSNQLVIGYLSNQSNVPYSTQDSIIVPGRGIFGSNLNTTLLNIPTNNSITAIKNNVGEFVNYELGLFDCSRTDITPAAFIGHNKTSIIGAGSGYLDGSLIIATPSRTNPTYSAGENLVQNIYMYPGLITSQGNDSGTKIPTFAVFTNRNDTSGLYAPGNVGIATSKANSTLDVNGSLNFTGDLTYTNSAGVNKIGLWQYNNNTNYTISSARGISYQTNVPESQNVSIGGDPKILGGGNASFTVYGDICADTYYILDPYDHTIPKNQLLASFWYDSENNNTPTYTKTSPSGTFLYNNVGIGISKPTANLHIANLYNTNSQPNNDTRILLQQNTIGDTPTATIEFSGTSTACIMQMNNLENTLKFGFKAASINSDPFTSSTTKCPLLIRNNDNSINVGINCSPVDLANTNTKALVVNGDTQINGTIYCRGINMNNYTLGIGTGPPVVGTNTSTSSTFSTTPTTNYVNLTGTPSDVNILTATQDSFGPLDFSIIAEDIYMIPNKQFVICTSNTLLTTFQRQNHSSFVDVIDTNSCNLIASFTNTDKKCLINLTATGKNQNNTINFGVSSNINNLLDFQDSLGNSIFGFYNYLDNYQDKFISTAIGFSTTNYVPQPKSRFQIYNTNGNGKNMLTLTNILPGINSSPGNAPEIQLQNYSVGYGPNILPVTKTWTIHGPDSAYNNKLSLVYEEINNNTDTFANNSIQNNEAFTFTNNSLLGINFPEPSCSIEILGKTDSASIKIHSIEADYNSAQPTIQLLSGSNGYGYNPSTDFQIYGLNSEFNFEINEPTYYGVNTIFNVASNGSVGIRQNAMMDYDCILNNINVLETIYLDGEPLFSILPTLANSNRDAFRMAACNILFMPTVATSNVILLEYSNTYKSSIYSNIYLSNIPFSNILNYPKLYIINSNLLTANEKINTISSGINTSLVQFAGIINSNINNNLLPFTNIFSNLLVKNYCSNILNGCNTYYEINTNLSNYSSEYININYNYTFYTSNYNNTNYSALYSNMLLNVNYNYLSNIVNISSNNYSIYIASNTNTILSNNCNLLYNISSNIINYSSDSNLISSNIKNYVNVINYYNQFTSNINLSNISVNVIYSNINSNIKIQSNISLIQSNINSNLIYILPNLSNQISQSNLIIATCNVTYNNIIYIIDKSFSNINSNVSLFSNIFSNILPSSNINVSNLTCNLDYLSNIIFNINHSSYSNILYIVSSNINSNLNIYSNILPFSNTTIINIKTNSNRLLNTLIPSSNSYVLSNINYNIRIQDLSNISSNILNVSNIYYINSITTINNNVNNLSNIIIPKLNLYNLIDLNASTYFSSYLSNITYSSNNYIEYFYNSNNISTGGIVFNPVSENFRASNLFHIFNTGYNPIIQPNQNANMMVLDSSMQEAQIHFRTVSSIGQNMYKTGMSNQSLFWEYNSPSTCTNSYYVSDSHNYYNRSFDIGPSKQDINQNLFDMNIYGNIFIKSPTPRIIFNDSVSNSIFGTSNGLMYLTNTSIGIGTTCPQSSLEHIYSSNNNLSFALKINQYTTGDVLSINSSNSSSEIIRILNNGYIGINTSSPNSNLHVVGKQLYDGVATFNSNVYFAQDINIYGNTITHGETATDSDRRLKTDIVRIEKALDKIEKINGYTFMRKGMNKRSTGLIAQEVQEVLPEAVIDENEYLSLAYGNLIGLIVEGIKELKSEINEIKLQLQPKKNYSKI